MKRSQVYTVLSLLSTAVAPGIYIMYAFGVFEKGVLTTNTAISTGMYAGAGFVLYQLVRTAQKRIFDKDSPNLAHKGYAAALSHSAPWLLLLIFTGFIYFGIANIITHIAYITGMELFGSIFIGKQKYWDLKEREKNA